MNKTKDVAALHAAVRMSIVRRDEQGRYLSTLYVDEHGKTTEVIEPPPAEDNQHAIDK